VGACATAAAYAPLLLRSCACRCAVHLQDTGGGRPAADRRVRRSTTLPVAVLDGRVRAGAEQRGRCVGVAVEGSPVQRRHPAGDGGIGGGTGPRRPAADSAPRRPAAQKAHLALPWMSSGAPALMSARTAGKWSWYAAQVSAVLPSLCNAKAGEGSAWPGG
jgi:hypothetical protein